MKSKILMLLAALGLLMSNAHAGDKNPRSAAASSVHKLRKNYTLADLTKNIEYATARPTIKDVYYDKLDQLAEKMIRDNYAVSLRGHADSIGRYKYNWVLSDNRAGSVKAYLVTKGVKPERIITTPYGSTVPIASNKTEAGRQKNRRVEIELKKISK